MKNNFSERRLKLSDKVLGFSDNRCLCSCQKQNIQILTMYRQDSNFYYLSGYEEPDSLLLIRPDSDKEKFIIFVETEIHSGSSGMDLGLVGKVQFSNMVPTILIA